MSFDWKQYLEFSEHLKNNYNSSLAEAYNRSIVSRAYYSVFKIAQDELEMQGVKLPNRTSQRQLFGTHERLIFYFESSDNPVFQEIGENLKTMRVKRTDADYKKYKEINLKSAELQIDMAKQVMLKLEQSVIRQSST